MSGNPCHEIITNERGDELIIRDINCPHGLTVSTRDLDQWSTNPDDWPHTPPLRVYRELEKRDGNLFWRMEAGHAANLIDEALELLDELEQRVKAARAEALRDAADDWSDWDGLSAPEDWLRERADAEEGR